MIPDIDDAIRAANAFLQNSPIVPAIVRDLRDALVDAKAAIDGLVEGPPRAGDLVAPPTGSGREVVAHVFANDSMMLVVDVDTGATRTRERADALVLSRAMHPLHSAVKET